MLTRRVKTFVAKIISRFLMPAFGGLPLTIKHVINKFTSLKIA